MTVRHQLFSNSSDGIKAEVAPSLPTPTLKLPPKDFINIDEKSGNNKKQLTGKGV